MKKFNRLNSDHNLERLAVDLLMSQPQLHDAIRSFRNNGDRLNYWTDLIAPDDQCYDLQLYCVKGDAPCVAIHQSGYDMPFIDFFVDLDIFIPKMKTYKIEVKRKIIESGYVTISADDIGHANAIANEWIFNPMPDDASYYDACKFEVLEVFEEITKIKLLEKGV